MVSLAMEYFFRDVETLLKKCCLAFLWFQMFCWEWEGIKRAWMGMSDRWERYFSLKYKL